MPVTNGPSGTKPFATCPENADESAARIGACRKAFSEAAKKIFFAVDDYCCRGCLHI